MNEMELIEEESIMNNLVYEYQVYHDAGVEEELDK